MIFATISTLLMGTQKELGDLDWKKRSVEERSSLLISKVDESGLSSMALI
jgi:hypothetical protein